MATASERIREARSRAESDLWIVSDAPFGSVDLIYPVREFARKWLEQVVPHGEWIAGALALNRATADQVAIAAEHDCLTVGREVLVAL
jgi:hypothetical protein